MWFLIFLFTWISILLIGAFFSSGSFFKKVNSAEFNFLQQTGFFFCLMGTWTWSNILLLCCLASLLGEYGRYSMTSSVRKVNNMAALVRGFFIYLFLTAGQLLINGSLSMPVEALPADQAEFLRTSPEAYIRLSGVSSLMGFAVGFKPELFHEFLIKVTGTKNETEGNG